MIFAVRRALILVAALSGCWRDAADPPVAPIVISPKPTLPHVAGAEFGTFTNDTFTKSQNIRLAPGVVYGWRVRPPCKEMVDVRETIKTPSPGDWHVDPTSSKLSADRMQLVVENALPCFNGWVERQWTVTAGDPEGIYTVTVEVDGFTPVRFHPRFAR
jgi:hypothetical protein